MLFHEVAIIKPRFEMTKWLRISQSSGHQCMSFLNLVHWIQITSKVNAAGVNAPLVLKDINSQRSDQKEIELILYLYMKFKYIKELFILKIMIQRLLYIFSLVEYIWLIVQCHKNDKFFSCDRAPHYKCDTKGECCFWVAHKAVHFSKTQLLIIAKLIKRLIFSITYNNFMFKNSSR